MNSKQQDLNPVLLASFEKLYYAKYALDFPHSKSALAHCVRHNNKSCLTVFEHFKEAKNTLASLVSDKTLLTTLDIIEQSCLSKTLEINNNICYGAIMSLYFYDTAEQDNLLLKRISEYPKPIKNIIFNHEFLWFHNRPSVKQWNNLISTFDIDWSPDNQKQFVLNLFKQRIDLVEGDPWVFR